MLGLGFVFTSDDGSATIGVVVFITEGLGFVIQLSSVGLSVAGELVVGLVRVLRVVCATFAEDVGANVQGTSLLFCLVD